MTAAQHELVLYSRDEHVVTITLNRSEKRNAFNAELVEADRCSRTRGRDGAGYRCRFRVRLGRCR